MSFNSVPSGDERQSTTAAARVAAGGVVEPFPVADLFEEEPWFASARVGEGTVAGGDGS